MSIQHPLYVQPLGRVCAVPVPVDLADVVVVVETLFEVTVDIVVEALEVVVVTDALELVVVIDVLEVVVTFDDVVV